MDRYLWRRVLISPSATIAMVACASLAGYLLGRAIVIHQTVTSLDQYLKLTAAQDDASFAEARSVLNALKDSRYPFCSGAEIAYFRAAIFRSEYLKDAGHIRSGKIDCSATAGSLPEPLGPFKPHSRQDDGIIAYSNLVPISDPSVKRAALQLGSFYVVLDSNLPPSPGPVTLRLSPSRQGAASEQSSLPERKAPNEDEPNLSADSSGRAGNTLYSTRCSALHFNCVTASTTVAQALHDGIVTLSLSTFAGGILGILFGLACAVVYEYNRDLPQQLRRAIKRNELEVVYQPIVDLPTRRIVGAEALARWTDEEGNEVSPDIFVRIAESLGFVGGITKLVLRRALQDFESAFRTHAKFRLSLNVAGADLVDPKFLPMLEESLKRANVKPEKVVIEITERSATTGDAAMDTIRCLSRNKHSIHIDDFGTGQSNLDKLMYLFADTIKIDRTFTKVIGTDSVTIAILAPILAMARSLSLEVIVEGIETEYQADYFFRTKQKLYGQGWLYGHPVSAEEFHALLNDDLVPAHFTQNAVASLDAKPRGLYVMGSGVQ